MIPYGKHLVDHHDVEAVVDVLKSNYLTQGQVTTELETRFAAKVGVRHAIAANSATSCLHAACVALGIQDGDWVWTTPLSFVASSNCALYCGARIDFVDVERGSNNICPKKLEEKLIEAEKKSVLPKAVILVHLSGLPCDLREFRELSDKYNFFIIEDASHAAGATYLNQKIGSCEFSDICVFSLHPVKNFTSGEGGIATTNNPNYAKEMRRMICHGIERENFIGKNDFEGSWYYEQVQLGYNYRLSDIHAALGVSQLSKLDSFVSKRAEIAEIYTTEFSELCLTSPNIPSDRTSGWHLYIVKLDKKFKKFSHKEVFENLRAQGIGVNLHYIPIYRHPFYATMGFQPSKFPVSESYYRSAISLPIYPSLSEKQLDFVIQTVKSILR